MGDSLYRNDDKHFKSDKPSWRFDAVRCREVADAGDGAGLFESPRELEEDQRYHRQVEQTHCQHG